MANESKAPPTRPPFSIKYLLRLAWGLTLGLSSDEAQQNLNNLINEAFKSLWQPTQDSNTLRYLNNVNGSLSSFLRNMGYEKDFLVVELDTQKKIQEKEIENVNELADMTSLSSDGLITRTVAFFIGGASSVLAAWQSLFQSEEGASSLTNGTLNEIVTKVNNVTTITNQSTTEISGQVPSIPANLPNEIVIFLLGGSVAFIIFVVAMKRVKGWWIKNRILSRTIKEQQEHWETHVRPEFIRLLKTFFYDVKQITSEHYNQYREDILIWDDSKLTTYIKTILPREKLYIHNAEELKDLEMIRRGIL